LVVGDDGGANGSQRLESDFAKEGFAVQVKPLAFFQDGYGLGGDDGGDDEDNEDDDDDDEDDDTGSDTGSDSGSDVA
jgi:hypothetical protein